MKTLDPLSKRILIISVSLSMLILSISLLVFTLSTLPTVQAESTVEHHERTTPPWDDGLRGAVGLGIVDHTGYFVIWGKPNKLYKVDLANARDWYLD